MISMKTNPKLPVPPPRSQESVVPFTPPPGTDPGPIPDSISRKKHPELEAKGTPTLAALAAKIADPEKRAAIEKIEADKAAKRSTKRAVKKEVQKAKAAGETAKMPLTGKAARDAIKAEAAKANAKAEDKSGGKAAVRAAAKKAVAETKIKSSVYDWEAAELKAKAGTVPPTPKFSSYGPHLQKCHDMAKAGQAKELRDYLAGFNHEVINPGRKNLFRYGDLCLKALKVSSK